MPVQIGAKVHSFSNPIGLLSDCHRRIELFLGSLEAVAKTVDQPLNEETARGLTAALRYFREAAPKHTADEEELLFPRLHEIENSDVQATLAHLEELEKDHRWATAVHAEVERLGQQYLSTARLSPDEAEQFRAAISRLASMYKEHIRMEDSVIFPMADRLLSRTDRASIAREMADRRNTGFITQVPNKDSPR